MVLASQAICVAGESFRPLYDGDDCGTQRFSVPDGSTADGKATGGWSPAAIPTVDHDSTT